MLRNQEHSRAAAGCPILPIAVRLRTRAFEPIHGSGNPLLTTSLSNVSTKPIPLVNMNPCNKHVPAQVTYITAEPHSDSRGKPTDGECTSTAGSAESCLSRSKSAPAACTANP